MSNRRFLSLVQCRWVIALSLLWPAYAGPDEDREAVIAALQEIQDIVGHWQGNGSLDDKSAGWDESIECQWKFNKNGRVSLYLKFGGKTEKARAHIFEEAMITFDPAREVYVLRAYVANQDEPLELEGKPKTASTMVFDRTNKEGADDRVDRIDLKLLNDGDRLVYSVHRRIGKSGAVSPARHGRTQPQGHLSRRGRLDRSQMHCHRRRGHHCR